MRFGWVVSVVFLGAALTGCIARAEDPRILAVPLVKQRPYELVGANLSFEGEIDLVLSVDMPDNSSALYTSWWATAGTAAWNRTTLTARGCPEEQLAMSAVEYGSSYGESGYGWSAWCPPQPPGPWNATYHAEGALVGRICIINVPAGADERPSDMPCRYFPHFSRCVERPLPYFCKGRY